MGLAGKFGSLRLNGCQKARGNCHDERIANYVAVEIRGDDRFFVGAHCGLCVVQVAVNRGWNTKQTEYAILEGSGSSEAGQESLAGIQEFLGGLGLGDPTVGSFGYGGGGNVLAFCCKARRTTGNEGG